MVEREKLSLCSSEGVRYLQGKEQKVSERERGEGWSVPERRFPGLTRSRREKRGPLSMRRRPAVQVQTFWAVEAAGGNTWLVVRRLRRVKPWFGLDGRQPRDPMAVHVCALGCVFV